MKRLLLLVILLSTTVLADTPRYLRCALPDGTVILLTIADLGGIGGAIDACQALGGHPRGVEPKGHGGR